MLLSLVIDSFQILRQFGNQALIAVDTKIQTTCHEPIMKNHRKKVLLIDNGNRLLARQRLESLLNSQTNHCLTSTVRLRDFESAKEVLQTAELDLVVIAGNMQPTAYHQKINTLQMHCPGLVWIPARWISGHMASDYQGISGNNRLRLTYSPIDSNSHEATAT